MGNSNKHHVKLSRESKSIWSPDDDERTFEHFSATDTDIGNGERLADKFVGYEGTARSDDSMESTDSSTGNNPGHYRDSSTETGHEGDDERSPVPSRKSSKRVTIQTGKVVKSNVIVTGSRDVQGSLDAEPNPKTKNMVLVGIQSARKDQNSQYHRDDREKEKMDRAERHQGQGGKLGKNKGHQELSEDLPVTALPAGNGKAGGKKHRNIRKESDLQVQANMFALLTLED